MGEIVTYRSSAWCTTLINIKCGYVRSDSSQRVGFTDEVPEIRQSSNTDISRILYEDALNLMNTFFKQQALDINQDLLLF